MRERIHIFHTNDLHSHFTYWKRSQNFIEETRKMLAAQGETSFLIDLGDHLDRSNLVTEATLGQCNIEMLNDANYDVVTLGNNEGITLSHDELYHLYDDASFEVVVGNLFSIKRKSTVDEAIYDFNNTIWNENCGISSDGPVCSFLQAAWLGRHDAKTSNY